MKPKQILEVEKLLGFELTETNDLDNISDYTKPKTYFLYPLLSKHKEVVALNLFGSKISDLSFLKKMNHLIILHLWTNDISEIFEIKTLKGLITLNLLNNQIKDISPIQYLERLEKLFLGKNHIKKISSLQYLKLLKVLDLHNNQVRDISPIQELKNLTFLNLSENLISEIKPSFLKNLKNLKELYISGNPIKTIPKEIIDDGNYGNCLPALKAYFEDGKNNGWDENKDLKLVLIGNGYVGKTSLVNRLVDDFFDENYKSTHGIQIKQYTDLQPYNINIWDFGGQDIYHATHRLFMQTRALFLLVWDWTTETNLDKKQKIGDYEYQNYDLDYWLNYVKVLGKGSKVIVVQTKFKRDGKKMHLRENELRQKYQDIWLDTIWIESEENNWAKNEFKKLKLAIENAIESGQALRKEKLPKNWIDQRGKIQNLQEEKDPKNKKQTINYKDFVSEMCKGNPLSPDTILNWLSDSGVVFYRKGLFENKIIINQQWAIDAVYTLFDRETNYPNLKNKKWEFEESEFTTYWIQDKEGNKYTVAERKLFISFLISCEICYLNKEKYVFPSLMPDEKSKIVLSLWKDRREDYFVKYQLKFFHYGTMQSFLVRLHSFQDIETNYIWQYGVSFEYKEMIALVEADTNAKHILVRVSSREDKSLIDKIRNLIDEIESVDNIEEISYSIDGNIFFTEKDSEKYEPMKVFFKKDEKDTFHQKTVMEKLNGLEEGQKSMQASQESILGLAKETSVDVKEIKSDIKDLHVGIDLIIDELGDLKDGYDKLLDAFEKHREEYPTILEKLLDKFYQDNETDITLKYTNNLKNGTFTFSKGKFKGITIPFKADKLEKNSLEMLACGVYMYEKIGHTNQDKAPINLEFCRIIETEFSAKIFNGFKNYLIEEYIKTETTSVKVSKKGSASSEQRIQVSSKKYEAVFSKMKNEEKYYKKISNLSDFEDWKKHIKGLSEQVFVSFEKSYQEKNWNDKIAEKISVMLGGIGYGVKVLDEDSLEKVEFVKLFRVFIYSKFDWIQVKEFEIRNNLLVVSEKENLIDVVFKNNKNPNYREVIFAENGLRGIYRNPSGHTGIFTTEENKNYKAEYCINIVLAFLKVWTTALKQT